MTTAVLILWMLLSPLLLFGANCPSGNLYVDYDGGSDSAIGTSTDTAWKHAPGDANATGNAGCTFIPDNTINFRGGVRYQGSIAANANGTDGHLITYRTGTEWGTGRAIIDGGTQITGWTPCASQAGCLNNTNWASMYYVDLAAPSHLSSVMAYLILQGTRKLNPAQYPLNTREWYQTTSDYHSIAAEYVTTTTITDARFDDLGGSALIGKYIIVWHYANAISFSKITGYNAETKTVTWADELNVYEDRATLYAVANVPGSEVFGEDGQFYYDETAGRLYVIPYDGEDISTTNSVYYSSRSSGINTGAYDYITITDLTIQMQSGDEYQEGVSVLFGDNSTHNILSNSTVKYQSNSTSNTSPLVVVRGTNHTISGNTISYQAGIGAGMMVYGSGHTISANMLSNLARTGVYFSGASDSALTSNTISDCYGTHGNAFSVYQDSSNITISRNTIVNSNSATWERATNITIINNLLSSGLVCWTTCSDSVIANNLIGPYGYGYGSIVSGSGNTIANNIGWGSTSGSNVAWSAVDGGTWFENAPRMYRELEDVEKMVDVTDITRVYVADGYSSMCSAGDVLLFSFEEENQYTVASCSRIIFSGNWVTAIDFTPAITIPEAHTGVDSGAYATIWPAGTTSFDFDYRPKQGSGSIDYTGATDMSAIFSTDMLGTSRPQGSGWDIGAFELITNPTATLGSGPALTLGSGPVWTLY